MTPESVRSLRDELPAFADGSSLSPQMQAYCRYYGIDFAGRRPGLNHQLGVIRSGEYSLAVHRWCQPGATGNLLLLHGYFDHSGLFGRLIEYGLTRNCNVLIFDLPGHGLSSGEPAVIDEFHQYGQAVADVLAQVQLPTLPLSAMAQSTGSAALVEYARGHSWPFAGVVLLAPLVRPTNWFRVRAAHAFLHRFVDSVEREFMENSSDREFLAFLQSDPLQSRHVPVRWVGALKRWLASLPIEDLGVGPALVLQGKEDTTVSWRYNLQIINQLFPGSTVQYLPGAGHHLANESGAIRERYLEAVDRYLGLAPGTVTAD